MLLFNPEFGLLNYALGLLGITGPFWLGDPNWTKPALILMSLWGVGGNMVIYLAGLQGIPRQLYEAAEMDGASPWQKFWSVTIPMLTPVIFFNLIMNIVWSFQIFTQVYVISGASANDIGRPANSTLVLVAYIYKKAFVDNAMGYGSALAWILFIIVLIVTLLQFTLSKTWVYYEGELKK
jgi:multiple sugar transport system permease protein